MAQQNVQLLLEEIRNHIQERQTLPPRLQLALQYQENKLPEKQDTINCQNWKHSGRTTAIDWKQWQDHCHRKNTRWQDHCRRVETVAGPLPPSGNSGRNTAIERNQWQEHCHREESVAGTLPPIGHTAAGPLLPSGNRGRTTATDW